MTNQDIFNYLKDNLEIRKASKEYYAPDSTCIWFELWLTPPNGDPVKISQSDDFTVYKSNNE